MKKILFGIILSVTYINCMADIYCPQTQYCSSGLCNPIPYDPNMSNFQVAKNQNPEGNYTFKMAGNGGGNPSYCIYNQDYGTGTLIIQAIMNIYPDIKVSNKWYTDDPDKSDYRCYGVNKDCPFTQNLTKK